MKYLATTLFVVCLLVAAAKNLYHDAHAADPQTADNRERYATPQACLDAMYDARDRKDFARYVSCFSTRLQNQQIGWLAFQLQQEAAINPKKQNQILEIYDKHNLKRINVMEVLQDCDSPGGKGAGYGLDLVGSRVKDKVAFITEADAVFSSKEKPTKPIEKPRLAEVKIEHETATAKAEPHGGETSAIYFRRINDSWVIADAVEVVSGTREMGSKAAVEPTQKVSQPQQESELDEKFRVSRNRCEAVRQLGEAGTKSIPALVELLKDQDCDVRATAATALGQIGPAAQSAMPILSEALNDQYSDVRSNAAAALVQIGPHEKTTIPAITRLLRDKDESVRRAGWPNIGNHRSVSRPDATRSRQRQRRKGSRRSG